MTALTCKKSIKERKEKKVFFIYIYVYVLKKLEIVFNKPFPTEMFYLERLQSVHLRKEMGKLPKREREQSDKTAANR